MPYADPEVRKQKDREYKKRPEVMARNRELYRKRYEADQGGIKTAKRAEHYKKWNDPEYRAKKQAEYERRWDTDWSRQKITQLRSRAKKLGLEFNIDASDIPLPKFCPVLGIELSVGDSTGRNSTPSVDRIDNTKGYVKGNVVVVSNKVNAVKRDLPLVELQKIVKFYEQLLGE